MSQLSEAELLPFQAWKGSIYLHTTYPKVILLPNYDKSRAGRVFCHCWMQKRVLEQQWGILIDTSQSSFQVNKWNHSSTSILATAIEKSDHMATNTYKKEMVSAICSQNQHTFTKVVESCCDLHRLNSYYVLEFHPSRKKQRSAIVKSEKNTNTLDFLKNYCAQCICIFSTEAAHRITN